MGQLKNASYYDYKYSKDPRSSAEYAKDPLSSVYYPLWRQAIEWIASSERIVDLGCGPGHFAQLAVMAGKKYIKGLDFSPVAVELARKRNPSLAFEVSELIPDTVASLSGFDVAVFLEVLEHLEDDISIVKALPLNKSVIFSVPSFDSASHVRYFTSINAIRNRYEPVMLFHDVFEMPTSKKKKIWLIRAELRR